MLDAREGCIKLIKKIDNNDNVVVIWLSLIDEKYANSVLTGQKINVKETKRLITKNRVIDLRKVV